MRQKIKNFQAKPSLAVISRNIRQYYWVLNAPLKFDQIEKFTEILKRFATHFGGTIDLSVSDKFLRAPDKLSQAFECDGLKYYGLAELETAISGFEPGNLESKEIPNPLEESVGIIEEDLGW